MTESSAGTIIVPVLLAEYNVEIGSGLLFAILCAVLAPGRGRSALAWFILGLIFNCIALLFLLLLPDLKEEADNVAHTAKELRRLREQVKKERFVADQRHGAHRARLDVHDRALGVDTSEQPPPALNEPETMYFFATGDKQLGPIPRSQLRRLCLDAKITDTTMVWREGMADWMPFCDVPELAEED